MASYFFYLLVSVFLPLNVHVHRAISESTKINDDPTQGFLNIPLNSSNFIIRSPYDLSVSDRYSFVDGIHKMWVLSSDKPHSPLSLTSPRTEIRIYVHFFFNILMFNFDSFNVVLIKVNFDP